MGKYCRKISDDRYEVYFKIDEEAGLCEDENGNPTCAYAKLALHNRYTGGMEMPLRHLVAKLNETSYNHVSVISVEEYIKNCEEEMD